MLAPSVAKVNAVLQLSNERPLRPYSISIRLGEGWLHNKTVSALRTLERSGIVRAVDRQGHSEYEPNPESPYADVARRLAFVDLGVRDLLPADARVVAIYLHGSVVEGVATRDSDLDVLVIGKVDPREARRALAPLERMLGRSLDVSVRTATEIREAIASGDASITRDSGAGLSSVGYLAMTITVKDERRLEVIGEGLQQAQKTLARPDLSEWEARLVCDRAVDYVNQTVDLYLRVRGMARDENAKLRLSSVIADLARQDVGKLPDEEDVWDEIDERNASIHDGTITRSTRIQATLTEANARALLRAVRRSLIP